MTTQHLIVKIQALLSGRVEMSPMQKRALALEYCRLCSDAEASLEHCIALIRAGREYPALQVAESANLLETINSLCFSESGQWRDYCLSENLPYPASFDDDQIRILNSLYSRGVTQTHPLYRDYRRAMRMRKYEDALSVIKTIGKINSHDAEVKGEINRLTRLVVKKKLAKLLEAMEAGNDEEFFKDYDFIEQNADFVADLPAWENVKNYCGERIRRRNAMECAKILSELKTLDAERNWERIIELVADFNSLRGEENFAQADIERMESLWHRASEIQEARVQMQHQAEARAKLSEEIESPSIKSASKRLRLILKLKGESGTLLDAALEERVNAELSALRRRAFVSKACRVLGTCAIAAAACWAVFMGWSLWESISERSEARDRLYALESLKDYEGIKEAIAEFEKDFPELLNDSQFSGRLAVVRDDMKVRESEISKVRQILDKIGAVDVSAADSGTVVAASEELSRASSAMSMMNRSDSVELSSRFEKLSSDFTASVDKRKRAVASKRGRLLDSLEELAASYEISDMGNSGAEAKIDEVLAELAPLMSDSTEFFKPSEMDASRYAELSAKLKTLRQAREKYAVAVRDILASKNLSEYIAAAESLSALSGSVPQKYTSGISNVLKNRQTLQNLFAFGIKNGELPIDVINDEPFSKSVFTQDKMLTDVYKYMRTSSSERGAKEVFTQGPVSEQSNKWTGGSEVMQQVAEIGLGGTVTKSLFRLQNFTGGVSRGETLVGGALTAESRAGREALQAASEKSTLAALAKIQAAKVDPIYKLLVENAIFKKLGEDPISSGLAYSPSAAKRKIEVENAAAKFFPYSWIFEGHPKKQLIQAQLYSQDSKPVDYEAEASSVRAALAKLRENPPKFAGVAGADGKLKIESDKALIAFGQDGVLRRFKSGEAAGALLPYSPVFEEQISPEDILKASNE